MKIMLIQEKREKKTWQRALGLGKFLGSVIASIL